MRHLKFVVNCALIFSSIGAFAQDSARTVLAPQWQIRRLRLRRPSSDPQPRPMDRPALPRPAFRASPARRCSKGTCRCNSRLCNSRRR